MALAFGILIAVLLGALTSVLARALSWQAAAAFGAACVGCAAFVDLTTDLGLDVVAPSLVVGAATKLALDRVLQHAARA